MEESIKVMNDFDTDSDQKLDPNEFGLFVEKFAIACQANSDEMIDFMIVASVLKGNTAETEIYFESLGNDDEDLYVWGE